ncbi:hypothetical protein VP01_3647g3 [Puccinia sorghi]|uniref:Uncharacterized protein n=1 Tax=Puccinia sorghi TaxID=27349 RepID=A0A0L6UUP6_9BASI|nr:hypothetical protein VP01_3647g3 [Puccinia sorghi]
MHGDPESNTESDLEAADQSWLAYTNRTILWLKERIVNTSIIISLPKKTILTLLNNIQHGQITINTNHQERFIFGTQKQQQEDLTVNIQVQNNAFWLRMFLLSDLGH